MSTVAVTFDGATMEYSGHTDVRAFMKAVKRDAKRYGKILSAAGFLADDRVVFTVTGGKTSQTTGEKFAVCQAEAVLFLDRAGEALAQRCKRQARQAA